MSTRNKAQAFRDALLDAQLALASTATLNDPTQRAIVKVQSLYEDRISQLEKELAFEKFANSSLLKQVNALREDLHATS